MSVQVWEGDGQLPSEEVTSVEQAVTWVLCHEGVPAYLRAMPFEALITLHHGMGQSIRNGLSLWEQPEPLFTDARRYFSGAQMEEPGMTMNGKVHPDCVSQLIIEQAWRRLRDTSTTAPSSTP